MASLFSCNCLVLFTDIISQMDMANHSGADYSMLNVHGVSRPQLRKRTEKENSNRREASSKRSGHSYERNNKNEENKFIGTEEKDVRLPAVPILDSDAFILGLYINLM
uniref:Uncharacterized protein n=1 Tax=Helianthus annuus TaxID=4232 RepID=A0A251URH3_HELAN